MKDQEFTNIIYLNRDSSFFSYQISYYEDNCESFALEAILNQNDNNIYYIRVHCENSGNPHQVKKRQIIKCPSTPTSIDDCQILPIYTESNINRRNNKQISALHIHDKLIAYYSNNNIFIGIADSTSLDKKCNNSIIFESSINFGANSNNLNYVRPCDEVSIYNSFSRFILVMKNNTIINIGQECDENEIYCFNTYFTIYSVLQNPFRFGLSKNKFSLIRQNQNYQML